jgi:hypothetical protein
MATGKDWKEVELPLSMQKTGSSPCFRREQHQQDFKVVIEVVCREHHQSGYWTDKGATWGVARNLSRVLGQRSFSCQPRWLDLIL